MSVYRPNYIDKKTGERKRSGIWWYHFIFAGRHIQESSKSQRKTVAVEAEKRRRLELEKGFNDVEDKRRDRIRPIDELATEFLEGYRLRHPKSTTFASYALGHVTRILGETMTVDVSDVTVKQYQSARLKEKASPKSVNEEVGFLLRILGDHGDTLRTRLRRKKWLKLTVNRTIARAFTSTEKAALLDAARQAKSPSIYPALMLALHAGMRDAEIRELQWQRVDLGKGIVTVGDSKTEAGEGRTIPLNEDALPAIIAHAKWYLDRFGETRPEWYLFPWGKPLPSDPTRPVTTLKKSWGNTRKKANVTGRWHDNRHTMVTDLAESGAPDEVIRDLVGHVSKQMLKHYSHIRMEAKRRAVAALAQPKSAQVSIEPAKESAKVCLLN